MALSWSTVSKRNVGGELRPCCYAELFDGSRLIVSKKRHRMWELAHQTSCGLYLIKVCEGISCATFWADCFWRDLYAHWVYEGGDF